jgi:hypothetical protein
MKKKNKLIAEFMGMTPCLTDEGDFLIKGNPIDAKYLPYDTSWDWLMPVANEIIKSRDEQNADWDMKVLKYALQTTNIELVYKAVVEFIKNQNN